MADYESSAGLDEFELGGERALDDFLVERDDDGESVSGWLRETLAEDVSDAARVELRRVDEAAVKEALVETSFHFQNSFRGQAYALSTRGRLPVSGTTKGEMRDEKLFHCPDTMYLASATDEALCSRLKAGRVVSNIVVKTGGGKSSVLPAHVAVECGKRILFVVPEANLKELGSERLSKVLAPTRMWSDEKGAELVVLTVMEVLGRFMGSGWDDVEKFFDVIVVDESHIPLGMMYALRAALVTKDIGQVSLLFLTATTGQADVQTVADPEYVEKNIEDVLADADFVEGPYAVDRTLILVDSDERVRNVSRLLGAFGLDVYVLESGATTVAIRSVCSALSAATASMRFVVAHEKFGLSYNFPIVRVLTTATTSVLVQREGEWFYGPSLLSDVEVAQQMGRAGRGIADSSRRGVVFAPKHAIPKYKPLRPSEVFSTYVYLVAMNIRPRKSIVEAVSEELPFGITPRVAAGLLTLSTCLPPRLAVRLLDGESRFPKRFVSGGRHFAHVGGLSPIGGLAQPVGFDKWHSVSVDEVLGCGGDMRVSVPVRAKGALGVHLTLLCAAAEGLFKPRMTYVLEMSGYESGPDEGKRPGKYRKVLELPTSYPVRLVTEAPLDSDIYDGYALDVPLADQPHYGRRMARLMPNVVTDHLAGGGYRVGIPEVSYVNVGGEEKVRLDFSTSPVALHSPGGTVAFQVDKQVWGTMVAGEALSSSLFRKLARGIGSEVLAFAGCDAFAVWGNPWLSILKTFQSDEILRYVALQNISSWLVTFLAALWKRYCDGMKKAVLESHQVSGMWSDLVRKFKRSLREKHGIGGQRSTLPAIAQSQEFHERIFDIRAGFSLVLDAMEERKMFDPARVAELQKILPISRRLSNPIHDGVRRGVVVPLGPIEKSRLLRRFGSSDGSSHGGY